VDPETSKHLLLLSIYYSFFTEILWLNSLPNLQSSLQNFQWQNRQLFNWTLQSRQW